MMPLSPLLAHMDMDHNCCVSLNTDNAVLAHGKLNAGFNVLLAWEKNITRYIHCKAFGGM
jgi:hypothetical protein